MTRFDELIAVTEDYQALAAENYTRIRRLAEELRAGFCDWLDARDGLCVRLVPPFGPFEPKPYTDEVFSIPPRGFRPLGPVTFGLAVRVSRGTDWFRMAVTARKAGSKFHVSIHEGPETEFDMPLNDETARSFYELIWKHLHDFFAGSTSLYREGEYAQRGIGFDLSRETVETA